MATVQHTPEEKKHRLHELISNLRDANIKARTAENSQEAEEHHKRCGSLVRELERSGHGTVSNTFRNLDYLGKGKPGDRICLRTKRYVELVRKEEAGSMEELVKAEDEEKEIANEALKKRTREKAAKLK